MVLPYSPSTGVLSLGCGLANVLDPVSGSLLVCFVSEKVLVCATPAKRDRTYVGYNIGMFVQPCVRVAMLEYLILWFLLRVASCRVRPVCGLHPGMIVTYGIMDKNL